MRPTAHEYTREARTEVVHEDFRARALTLLDQNTQHAIRGETMYRFAAPTSDAAVNMYRIPPLQWTGWDSQLHAIVFAACGDVSRATDELRSIFANQREDGFIPHVSFWETRNLPSWAYLESPGLFRWVPGRERPTGTANIQPPLLAQAVERVWKESHEDAALLTEWLFPLAKYYRWLAEHRDPDGDGLISVLSQNETGLDYSPAYDSVIGYRLNDAEKKLHRGSRNVRRQNKWLFRHNPRWIYRFKETHVEDVLVNSIYIKNLAIVARLARIAGETALETWAADHVSRATFALLTKSYDAHAGVFWNLAGKHERPVRVKTIISLMPLIIDDLPRNIADELVAHLTNPEEFWTPYPVPSTARSEPAFVADSIVDGVLRIWRGPLSMNTNWYLVHALRQHGYVDVADSIAEKSRELVRRSGFNEFYNPNTGEPCGADQFGWATLVADM